MLVEKIKQAVENEKDMRFRDRRAFYASELTKDARDLYWSLRGEKETNPTDFVGKFRMNVGKAIETMLVHGVLANLHDYGFKLAGGRGGQIKIGLSNPNVDGDLDGILVTRENVAYVLEIKTKNGYGADLFRTSCDPESSYLAQMGIYLKDLSAKGVTNKGIFLFVLISDKNYATIVEVECRYDQATDEVIAFRGKVLGEATDKVLDYRLKLQPLLDRLVKIQKCATEGVLPPADYRYKYELTPEFLSSVSDASLEKAINGHKILGDWQISYSRYKDLHIQQEGSSREYTPAELTLLKAEWAARHPRSKKFKDVA